MAEPAATRRALLRAPSSDPRTRTVFPSENYSPDHHERASAEIPPRVPSTENPDADAQATPTHEKERPRSG
jgi:hypothetical protein